MAVGLDVVLAQQLDVFQHLNLKSLRVAVGEKVTVLKELGVTL